MIRDPSYAPRAPHPDWNEPDEEPTRAVLGKDLRVGDHVVWFIDGRTVTITALRPYAGPLASIFEPHGAQLAECARQVPSGFTVENGNVYEVAQ